jgi:alginate O-acetyltransferase complex protein AlgI
MLFNSPQFLFLFLPATYLGFWALRGASRRYLWLTATGYVFYASWNFRFCALMAFSTLISYVAGLGFLRWSDPRLRRLCLIIPVTLDLSLLAIFKYADFGLAAFARAAETLGRTVHYQPLEILLPIGISFYTFHTITYIVDCYRGDVKPTRNFFEFASYVSFFAQLVAGPIARFRQVEGDFERLGAADRRAGLPRGWSFFTIGMIKKVLIADTIAAIIDPALEHVSALSSLDAWLCVLGYTYQLYFDFSGYSDMAVGLGHLFGIRLPQNFDSPYKAETPADFWRRWHISLSTVLRDYLYIPLGGSRGSLWATCRNVMITMALGGLWHGANWTFVFWGCYHGVLLVAYRLGGRFWDRLPAPLRRGGMFLLVVLGWLFFRSRDFAMAGAWLAKIFSLERGTAMPGRVGLAAALSIAAACAHFGPNSFQLGHEWKPAVALLLTALFGASLLVILGGRETPFLYFQF